MSRKHTLSDDTAIYHDGIRLRVQIEAGGTAYIERYPSLDDEKVAGPVHLNFSSFNPGDAFNPGDDFEAAERWALAILRAVIMARLVREGRLWPVPESPK